MQSIADNKFGIGITSALNAFEGSVNRIQMRQDEAFQNQLNAVQENERINQMLHMREIDRSRSNHSDILDQEFNDAKSEASFQSKPNSILSLGTQYSYNILDPNSNLVKAVHKNNRSPSPEPNELSLVVPQTVVYKSESQNQQLQPSQSTSLSKIFGWNHRTVIPYQSTLEGPPSGISNNQPFHVTPSVEKETNLNNDFENEPIKRGRGRPKKDAPPEMVLNERREKDKEAKAKKYKKSKEVIL